MTIREKIIISIMVLVVLIGGYSFFSGPGKKNAQRNKAKIKEINRFMLDMADMLNKKGRLSSAGILRLAGAPWKKDPFAAGDLKLSASPAVEKSGKNEFKKYSYTGFINTGKSSMVAIINKMEYEKGDFLEKGGYEVKMITPEKVILARTGKKAGLDDEISIPLQ